MKLTINNKKDENTKNKEKGDIRYKQLYNALENINENI